MLINTHQTSWRCVRYTWTGVQQRNQAKNMGVISTFKAMGQDENAYGMNKNKE